jgi:hypothetical protein
MTVTQYFCFGKPIYIRMEDMDKANRLGRDLIAICKKDGSYHKTDTAGNEFIGPRYVHRDNLQTDISLYGAKELQELRS